ncbi:iron-sulfur cluster repair di-iron protein [Bacillus sp. HMF5848]|uniref:iron-sulfur cluster repair di-iron protein n=1 Tax=Bacillus sp. HMF5848 TaxID=2495421 RepID=UPI000F775CDB|nr:iron-sulfur cluster repair di-iron protein [Bacillus sp. HMF5848]RSK27929.1 iron-sulfur cluster repair di-iron protein [Bacillus sp. HMF5848]
MTTFTEQSRVGDIVTIFPKASDIFKANRIDFCCGGNKPISEACEERGVDASEILNTLNTLIAAYEESDDRDINWAEKSNADIIDYVVTRHHQFLYEELPNLSPYITKVFRVHGGHHPHLVKVHTYYNQLKTELEQHLMQEETKLFPSILAYDEANNAESKTNIAKLITDMEQEHDEAGDLLKKLREVTNDYTLPPGACRTYQTVYKRLEDLESDMFAHVHLENNVLFKRFV